MAFLLLFLLAVTFPEGAIGQTTPLDTLSTTPDSLQVSAPQGDIETTVVYSARDSIRFEVGHKIVHLYGDANITYGTIKLDAAYIQINWETNTLTALGTTDTAGNKVGTPVFVDDADTYTADRIAYNFKTKRGKIAGVVTKQGEGFVHAEVIKKEADNTIYGLNGRYTTCNLEHPHFFINAHKMKVIPGDRVISGPFNLVIGDVPTPVGFPLGLFPTPKKRASGIIIPTVGESRQRGFFLRDGGYYWAVNDYLGLKFLGEIYSLGGYGGSVEGNYTSRYRYNGNFRVSTRFIPAQENTNAFASTDPLISRLQDERSFWVNWSHQPKPRPGGGRFSASVNLGSEGYNRYSFNTNNYLSASFNSTIKYSKVIRNSPFQYDITLNHGQTADGAYNVTLPAVSFGMTQQSPLQLLGTTLTGRWYENITVGYRFNAENRFSNRFSPLSIPTGFTPFVEGFERDTILSIKDNFSEIISNSRVAFQHDIPVSLGNFKILRYLSVSPTVSYRETWFLKQLDYNLTDNNELDIDTLNRFSRVNEYSAGLGVTTNIYGTFVTGGKKVEAIRHTLRPNLNYNYRPDFGRPSFDYYQYVRDRSGISVPLSRYNNFIYGIPTAGRISALSFSLSNNVEMKLRSNNDSVSTSRKVPLLEDLSIGSSYNFAADSLKFNIINISARTTLFQLLQTQITSSYDPYIADTNGFRINRFVIDQPGSSKLARHLNTSFSVNFNLNQDVKQRFKQQRQEEVLTNSPAMLNNQNPYEYVDFDIPWQLSVNYTYVYATTTQEPTVTQALQLNGELRLTDNWKVQAFTNYDFTNKQFSYTTIDIYRDLHCWEMSLRWIPVGFQQSISFTINAKASILRDLKLTRNRTFYDR